MRTPLLRERHLLANRFLALALIALLVAGDLLVEMPYEVAHGRALSNFAGPSSLDVRSSHISTLIGDLNNDSLLDLIVINANAESQILLNTGAGRFARPMQISESSSTVHGAALGDLNGDGALDMAFRNQVWLNANDGSGTFLLPSALPGGLDGNHLALGDLNGDGALDVVLDNAVFLNVNDGAATFEPPVLLAADNLPVQSVALGDLNDDGALDLVIDNTTYLNTADGTGRFERHETLPVADWQRGALGDLNGDGALDLLTADEIYLNTNDGAGRLRKSGNLPDSAGVSNMVLGDLNGDGALDVVTYDAMLTPGVLPLKVYINTNSGTASFFRVTFPPGGESDVLPGPGLALGDLDGDNFLDLVVPMHNTSFNLLREPSRVYRNTTQNFAEAVQLGASGNSDHVALADLNGDGALDVAQGNQILLNPDDGSLAFPKPAKLDTNKRRVAAGDINGDGPIDLVYADDDFQAAALFLNNGSGRFGKPVDLPGRANRTNDLALGDLNGDGALDVVLANYSYPSQVYINRNDGTGRFAASVDLPGKALTRGVALGDLDGDGALDIVFANFQSPSQIYLNLGDGTFAPPIELPGPASVSASDVAIGNLNGDEALDIVLARGETVIYLNDGLGGFAEPQLLPSAAQAVALADLNGDRALDIVQSQRASNFLSGRVFFNDGVGQFRASAGVPAFSASPHSIAAGDLNNDGAPELVFARGAESAVVVNRLIHGARQANSPPAVTIARPGRTPDAPLYSTPQIIAEPIVPVRYTLFDQDRDLVRAISATYSLDGGGTWRPALATADTPTTGLQTAPEGVEYVFRWDTFASGLFGQSDTVLFRLAALSSVGPFQRPDSTATTVQFRVRGTQVQVVNQAGAPVGQAQVFRLPQGAVGAARPILGAAESLLSTNQQGYLPGRGPLAPGDRLLALQTITHTDSYTLYLTSAAPISTGLALQPVTEPGLQQLTISPAHPLMLLRLTVSIEWDARGDDQFMSQLRSDLERASELLYDWTDGQAALGAVTIYHDKQRWSDELDDQGAIVERGADIRIYASNRLRPNASQGGISPGDQADPDRPEVVYERGPVQIGAVWNRNGDIDGALGEDWPRALAHELGHYAFFLDDNYLGLVDGRLATIEGCPGAMSNPYRDDWSEFVPAGPEWDARCAQTLSAVTTGRPDWQTIKRFYDAAELGFTLRAPPAYNANVGPSVLALDVTRIAEVWPDSAPPALSTSLFTLVDELGARYQPSPTARAFLFDSSGSRAVDLGQPTLDQVLARGARVGDTLCVYDLDAGRLGCETIRDGDTQLVIERSPGWSPEVRLAPAARALTIAVPLAGISAPPADLRAQVFPEDGAPSQVITLTLAGGQFAGTLELAEPTFGGVLRVWDADGVGPPREVIADYGLAGNPAPPRKPRRRSRRRAPALSPDGQVVLYGDNLSFEPGQFYSIQTATALPNAPRWTVPVGQGYQLLASPSAPDLTSLSVNMSYFEGDLPAGSEGGVGIYFWDGATWSLLDTELDTERNEASAQALGPGLYALMTSLGPSPGWNLVAYPWQPARTVAESLARLNAAGAYSVVYGLEPSDEQDPWKVYDSQVPPEWAPLVNDLARLRYGQGYWIYVTDAGLPRSALRQAARPTSADTLTLPPATYYGLAPAAGLTVEAYVGDALCGSATTRTYPIGGRLQPVFALDVLAASADAPECGVVGSPLTISFRQGVSVLRSLPTTWDNTQVNRLIPHTLFLPVASLAPSAHDLTVVALAVAPAAPAVGQPVEVVVTIRNNGTSDIATPFWVDLYLDPSEPPQVNLTWPELSDYGVSWKVYGLKAGETRVLSSLRPNDPLDPRQDYSNFERFVSGGAHKLVALADAYAPGRDEGAVAEDDEDNNQAAITVRVSGQPPTAQQAAPAPVAARPGAR